MPRKSSTEVRYTGESVQYNPSRIGRDLESNAEYQRRKTQMTQDEKNMDARDRMAKNIHDQAIRDGKKSTFDEAHRYATNLVEKIERKKREGDQT